MIERFVSYKEPYVFVEDKGIIFRTHVVMSGGMHILISDSKMDIPDVIYSDETMAFECSEEGAVSDWDHPLAGGKRVRTEDVIKDLQESNYRSLHLT
jgi:hypothetical protein